MSFITKRERVFNEYDLFDLPARNEGKLKAYASCTDARAWSHFCSDKTEHLVEIIKRNNEICRPKYVPTDVIVDTLMVAKNAEIARLKRRIEEFEQMLAAYDQLELTCEQKCDIANAHAAIKAANKELDELCLDLDLSGFTEGIDSEAFETGKSRGDEPTKYRGDELSFESESTPKKEAKSNQTGLACPCDASTSVTDPRIEEMQGAIISKDAKLNAMKNTIAVMENDVCEPYCIYAHIYTALEKIFGILCQNEKYKQYLDLLTAGKDTRCIDIKGKILYKLKVLEKFCLALIAPCSQDFSSSSKDCACYHAEIVARVETTFALTSAEYKQPSLDNKRAHLVADIMENEEMKEILSKESEILKNTEDHIDDDFGLDNYNIETENLKRLKNLQENYDDLMTCYEALKHEKDYLLNRCHKYEELEKELESLRNQVKEYSTLWTEKEHYRKRSEDLDALKEQYLILCDETSNLETRLKAETEINNIKCDTLDELRGENIALEKKINEISITFEKEKNILQCKLKETECKVMCQEQQIKSLTDQIDRLLEQGHTRFRSNEDESHSIALMDEIESLKEQVKNLKEALFCNEEEKQQLQIEFEEKLKLINELIMEIEDWKSTYEKTLQRNDYLEKYTENFREEMHKLIEENRVLTQDVDEKSTAVGNLINLINSKSLEMNNLIEEIERKKAENSDLLNQLHDIKNKYENNLTVLEKEKEEALSSLLLAKQESQELLKKVKDYDEVIHKQFDMSKSLEAQAEDYKELKEILISTIEENKILKKDLQSEENNNNLLRQEIQRLREINSYAIDNITGLREEKNQLKLSLDLSKKESEILMNKISDIDVLSKQMEDLKESQEQLMNEKQKLENELRDKTFELDSTIHSIHLTKKESEELEAKLHKTEKVKEDLMKLNEAYQKLVSEKQILQIELVEKNKNIDNLLQSLNNVKAENTQYLENAIKNATLQQELTDLKKIYEELLIEKSILQNDFDNKNEEINNLYNTLENKIEENRDLLAQIKSLELHKLAAEDNIATLQNDNLNSQTMFNTMKKDSEEKIDKLKHYETEYIKLKQAHDKMASEKEMLQKELASQLKELKKIEQENQDLNSHSQNLLTHAEELEETLIKTRNELMGKSTSPQQSYANIMKEIENMRNEKILNQTKIRDLLDKLDESENIISNLSEDILTRDDKIAILENHINELEDEVRLLHQNLVEAVDTGEQISDYSHQAIDKSLKKMEAHHSKAIHNMKIDIAKLHNENSKLEEQLSVTKFKTEETSRDKNKYLSQINNLQNEREIIVTDIKQLELKSVGDSALSPDNCDVESILLSLDRIRKCLDVKHLKSTSLEQTLLKVQTSSQLLLSKADEAKKIVEKEKQKIINEKEEAIKDRLHMENQLLDMKTKLEKQIHDDQNIIKDLEAEILNQKLIIDKINNSTQNYISKLEDELQSLQEMYQNSIQKLSELQEKNQYLNKENSEKGDIIEKTNMDLERKRLEIVSLQKSLNELKNKQIHNIGIQTQLLNNHRNESSQTDYINENRYHDKNIEFYHDIPSAQEKMGHTETPTETMLKTKPPSINEVQILTANIEPTFDFVKSNYLNYKLKQLGPGKLEQYSISGLNATAETTNKESYILSDNLFSQSVETPKTPQTYTESTTENPQLVDIYNRQSIHTNSSKNIGNDDAKTLIISKPEQQTATKSSVFTGFGLTNDSFETKSRYKDSNSFTASATENSVDNDIFLIYKDSENNDNKIKDGREWVLNDHPEILVESVTVQKAKHKIPSKNRAKDKAQDAFFVENIDGYIYLEEEEENEDEYLKPKLNINLPRVETDTPSLVTISDFDKKSLDSYTRAIYSSPKHITQSDKKIHKNTKQSKPETQLSSTTSNIGDQYVESHNSLDIGSDEETIARVLNKKRDESGNNKINDENSKQPHKYLSNEERKESYVVNRDSSNKEAILVPENNLESYHKLSRVDADVFLIKTNNMKRESISHVENHKENFGLKYILDSVQQEVKLNSVEVSKSVKIRKTKSDERFSQSQLTKLKSPHPEQPNANVPITQNRTKSLVERGIMVNTNNVEDYENKIKTLTNTLENIEKDYKKKIEAIKIQYDSNIKSIINEHNQGVRSIQNLHEETLQDIIKIHESEVENLRTMSIEAMRKADKLERENRNLITKMRDCSCTMLDDEPIKMSTADIKKRNKKCCNDSKLLTKTNVEAFNVKPKPRSHGPCTCSLDVNISDTIRNIFEQVDVEQRKMAEHAYIKYIANKILNGNVEVLDAQELSFLHLKVCRTWKSKLSKEEALQRKIDSLENELMHKQRHAQQHIAELDRKVAEERRRLQEVREAVCRGTPRSRDCSPDSHIRSASQPAPDTPPAPPPTAAENDFVCNCNLGSNTLEVNERRSAGDLLPGLSTAGFRPKRPKNESNRASLAKLDGDERRDKKLYHDEPPTRLRRSHDRGSLRPHRK